MEYRIEHDTMGEVRVPKNAKYQAQTQRAVENFPISGRTLERTQIRALALIKAAAAKVNAELGVIPPEIGAAVQQAANEIAEGKYYEDFPLDVFQTGSGTSSNMNTNEVIATLADRVAGQQGASRTTTSTPRSRPTTSSRPRSTWPPPRRSCTSCCRRWPTWSARCRPRPTSGRTW